jgi:hypothetical protein
LVLSGYASKITIVNSSLSVVDGMGERTVKRTFGRAHCPISLLISTQAGGYISFTAIRWLHDIGAAFIHLNYDGTPLMIGYPRSQPQPSLRRKQVLISTDGLSDRATGAAIALALILNKIDAQIRMLEHFGFMIALPRLNNIAADYQSSPSIPPP